MCSSGTITIICPWREGQGYRAERTGNLLFDGVLLQLRADASFRTNIGVANMQNTVVTATFTLYDKYNNKVSEKTISIPPFRIIGPTSVTSGFFFDAGTADLSDAPVTFHCDETCGVYASVVDNGTTDPTYFAAMSPTF